MSSGLGSFSVKMMIFLFPATVSWLSDMSMIFRCSACLLKIGFEHIGANVVVNLVFSVDPGSWTRARNT